MARHRNRPRRPNATGRNDKSSRYAALPHRVTLSEAYCSLDPTARALLVELAMMENSKNNGSLYMSIRDATDRLGLSDYRPIMRAFDDLSDRGLIALTQDAHFEVKASETSRARCWRLTWIPWPSGPKGKRHPSHDYEHYLAPAQSRERKRALRGLEARARYRKALQSDHFPVVDFTTMEAQMAQNDGPPVGDSTTANSRTDAIPPFSVVGDSTAHTAVTMGCGGVGWWTTDAEERLARQILLLAVVNQNRPQLARRHDHCASS